MSGAAEFYDANADAEWKRLEDHRTEFAVTMRALEEYLPSSPARVADVGGGPGRYSIALAPRYDVTLIDLSEECLKFARAKAEGLGVALSGYVHADARDLGQLESESFDAVLLMGPLYHLLEEDGRRRAVSESLRILRAEGVLFAAFLTRYAPIRYWGRDDPIRVFRDLPRYEHLLATGELPISNGFTDVYCVASGEVRPFMEEEGLSTLDVIACEGLVSMIERNVNGLTGDAWEAWVELNYQAGKDPSLHGAAEHLLYVGRKA